MELQLGGTELMQWQQAVGRAPQAADHLEDDSPQKRKSFYTGVVQEVLIR